MLLPFSLTLFKTVPNNEPGESLNLILNTSLQSNKKDSFRIIELNFQNLNPHSMRMIKNFIAAVLLLPMPFYLWSQSGLEIGAFWLPQTYRLLNDDDINFFTYDAVPITINSYGAFVAINSKRKIGFYTGFISTVQGQRYLTGESDLLLTQTVDYLKDVRLSYYKIPIFIQFKTNGYQSMEVLDGRRVGLSLQFGPQINLLQRVEWIDFDDHHILLTNNQGMEINIKDAYKHFSISLGTNLGINVAVSKKLTFNCQLRIDYTIDDVENKKFLPEGQNFYHPRRLATTSTSVGLQSGISFLIARKN